MASPPLLKLSRGPWRALPLSNGILAIRDDSGAEVCRMARDSLAATADNVRALAEAPALVDLLQTVIAGDVDAACAKADAIAQRLE